MRGHSDSQKESNAIGKGGVEDEGAQSLQRAGYRGFSENRPFRHYGSGRLLFRNPLVNEREVKRGQKGQFFSAGGTSLEVLRDREPVRFGEALSPLVELGEESFRGLGRG